MILFLDFDGVLHPIPTQDRNLLCHIPRLETVLRAFPDVVVVISSWWRASSTIHELREYFSADIRERIIDMTPVVTEMAPGSLFLASAKMRHDEILQWIADNIYTGPWVALDDANKEFPGDCPQLIRCETEIGFDHDAELRLTRYLAEHDDTNSYQEPIQP